MLKVFSIIFASFLLSNFAQAKNAPAYECHQIKDEHQTTESLGFYFTLTPEAESFTKLLPDPFETRMSAPYLITYKETKTKEVITVTEDDLDSLKMIAISNQEITQFNDLENGIEISFESGENTILSGALNILGLTNTDNESYEFSCEKTN